MKKLMIINVLVLTVAILTGCRRVVTIDFEPVIVDVLRDIEVVNTMILHSNAYTLQGVIIEDEYLEEDELLALLAELDIKFPELPELELELEFELTDADFESEIEETEDGSDLSIGTLEQEIWEPYIFNFEHAGIYTITITQIIPDELDEEWQIDDSEITLVVTVTEDTENEKLVATVAAKNGLVFENVFVYDISRPIRRTLRRNWEERVALAYDEGYEYVQNEDGEYERVAIYVPAPPAQNNAPAGSGQGSQSSNIPEDNSTLISNSDALSYLALVNRNFRLADNFSPGDLRRVNVASINGTHSMRSTAAAAAENLFQAAQDEGGHSLVATSGYRSFWTQQSTHNHWINVLGATEARRVSARPGHSEHQLGLALDITTHALGSLSQQFSSTPEGIWIRENAHRFGFIIRYPAGREAETGYIYEPWHIRFIGVDAATQMFGSGLILEQFLGVQ